MKAYKNVIIGVLASIRINIWKGIILSMFSDVCGGFCENKGTCVKDSRGQPSCRCVGSFIGPHCEDKSEFAYIAGGIAATVIFLIIIALFVWMICAR